ncbi:MAG: hypothetical protein OEZ68_17420 [Gammaproteobacteria bacterium]|nr:hypothetical protein [Gammaproteobacteria bacterium]MDH5802584.1 hypothetical protein [Gammaproteobacteria bacterium]
MSDCCASKKPVGITPKKHTCPVNNKWYSEVAYTTIVHHIKTPWLAPKRQPYYFCSDPDCPVVYFGLDNSIINKDRVRTAVGIKDTSAQALVCYCFGVTRQEAADPSIKSYVQEQTKQSNCSCAIFNPSGKCCLKDFPKPQNLTVKTKTTNSG